jgi:hypothetical protein
MITDKTLEEMEEFMNNNLTIKVFEKKAFGEVFTPPPLINKMLDSLPEDIYCNPSLKWLDPCAGIGNFLILIYFRLMNGLSEWEKDVKERSNHIIKNMLYMVELNKENVQIASNIFGKDTRIYCQDFLHFKTNEVFDIIIGNPPFQLKKGKGGKNKLYEQIVSKSLSILNPNSGKLLFLVPDNLFAGNSSKTYLKMLNHIKWIDFSNFWLIKSIQQKICCFLLEVNVTGFKKTKIITDLNNFEVDLVNRPINPIRDWHLKTELLINTYICLNKNTSIYNRGKNLDHYSNTYSLNSFPIIYKPNNFLYTDNKLLAVGFGLKKIVIFLISTKYEYYMDWNGEYGVGPNTIYIAFSTDLQGIKLESFFKSDTYKELMFACKTCRQFLKLGLIQYLNLDLIYKD